jgi:hypothetical protein
MIYPIRWVKLERYAEIMADCVDAVMARRKTGKWLDGEQCKMVDGRLWVNLESVEVWVENWDKHSQYRASEGVPGNLRRLHPVVILLQIHSDAPIRRFAIVLSL